MRYVTLLYFLIACGNGTDPTFAKLCEQPDGTFIYPIDSATVSTACEDPQEVTWPGIPLRVSFAELDFDYHSSLEEAVDFWNRELDYTLFVRDDVSPDIVATIGSASDDGEGACIHSRVGGVLTAVIELRQPGDVTSAYYILSHELGHAIGLAHDKSPKASIMNPFLEYAWYSEEDPDDMMPFLYVEVTGNDYDAIRKKYP